MAIRLPAPARRRQLLDTALEVFAERGFHETSMNDVADAAGVTKPVLYQHFTSKRELYQEIVEDVGTRLLDLLEAAGGAGSPRQQVETGFAAFFRFMAEHRNAYLILYWSGNRRDPEVAQTMERVLESITATLADLIAADLDDEHRQTLAHAVAGLAEGVTRHWVNHDLDLSPELLARQVADLAWSGLRGVHRLDG